MIIKSDDAENDAVLTAAKLMAAAARTAPKTRGIDYIKTLIVTKDDLPALADAMESLGNEYGQEFCVRDAGNIRNSQAVLLLASSHNTRGLGDSCGYCRSKNCTQCEKEQNSCVYDPMDLGIAIGSATSVAAAHHIDNRVMYSVGIGAKKLGLFPDDMEMVIGIPLSVHGKSVYFDRKPK